ncbi:transmembrane protein fend-like isoform X1 [Wyeomyia smithii]|uniref:transmembrane protein fend-like isoform X1 n=1 Tax=Wyeomyia smithii TaxID=174621 RepID=UPI002467CB77|nr:transmembrane protein fend-like isoform X1 [Wyeomyia smithii]
MAPVESALSVRLMVCLLTALIAATAHASLPTESKRNIVQQADRTVPASNGEQPPTATERAAAVRSCQEACLEKHSSKEASCSERKNCSKCQEKCTSSDSDNHRLSLVLLQMIRNESLVTADVAWVAVPNDRRITSGLQQQCLVTWEVAGGGLMGNLLTESSSAQLSLWPETNYRVQVTCRNKHTDALTRSAPIILNTAGATVVDVKQEASTRLTLIPPPPPPPPRPSVKQLFLANAADDDREALVELQELDPESGPSAVHPQLAVWPISRESQQEILLLGVFVALLMFLLILLTMVVFGKRKATPSGASTDKQVLVENDRLAVEILHV